MKRFREDVRRYYRWLLFVVVAVLVIRCANQRGKPERLTDIDYEHRLPDTVLPINRIRARDSVEYLPIRGQYNDP